MTTRYFDMVGGNDANDGLTMATAWKSLLNKSISINAGDDVRFKKSPDPTSLGQAATWTNLSGTITLTTAVTQTLENCESGWTQSTNIAVTYDTSYYKQGAHSLKITPAAAFTTGLVAYKAIGPFDLSGYQQLSFWAYGPVAAGTYSIRLCSDAAGATTVNTIAVPAIPTTWWQCITVDTGAAFGSSITSIAIYADLDPGTNSVYFDNIIACKASSSADALTLNSLIGKNTTAEREWWGIRSIDGATIILDTFASSTAAMISVFSGTTESATIWKRECIKPTPITSGYLMTMSKGGTLGTSTYTTYSGGWADDTTQNGETWIDGQNSMPGGIFTTTASNVILKKFGAVRTANGFYINIPAVQLIECYAAANAAGFNLTLISGRILIQDSFTTGGSQIPISSNFNVFRRFRVLGAIASNFAISGSAGAFNLFDTVYVGSAQSVGIDPGIDDRFLNCTVVDAPIAGIKFSNRKIMAKNYNGTAAVPSPSTSQRSSFYSHDHGGVIGSHRIQFDNGLITTDTTTVHTAGGASWKMCPSVVPSSLYWDAYSPMPLKVATIFCKAGQLTTVSAWVYRDSLSISMRLCVPGGQIGGISDDVGAQAVGAVGTWEQISISFTPTVNGYVDVEMQAWATAGSTVNGWVDDLSLS